MSRAKVLEICSVAPATHPQPQAPASLPLTVFDIPWLRFPPSSRLFFYESSQLNLNSFSNTLLPLLKRSLSLTLIHFLPLAGNLTWPQDSDIPTLCYAQGDAISLTVAQSEADFHHLSSDNFREAGDLFQLLPDLPTSENRALALALQVTLFPNAGFSIGYAAHHGVLDGTSISIFMKSWASVCKSVLANARPDDQEYSVSDLCPEPIPYYDRRSISDATCPEIDQLLNALSPTGTISKSLKVWEMTPSPEAMIGTFRVTKAKIESMKKWVTDKFKDLNKTINVSSFVVMSAYAWVCLVRAWETRPERAYLVFSADCRSRLESPLPPTYLGNCIAGCLAVAVTKDLVGEDGVAEAAKAMGEAITSLKGKDLKMWAAQCFSQVTALRMQGERVLSIAGSPRFEMYNVDFGWGRPRKIDVVSISHSGAFGVSDTRDGNVAGLEIAFALTKDQVEAFSSHFTSGLQAF